MLYLHPRIRLNAHWLHKAPFSIHLKFSYSLRDLRDAVAWSKFRVKKRIHIICKAHICMYIYVYKSGENYSMMFTSVQLQQPQLLRALTRYSRRNGRSLAFWITQFNQISSAIANGTESCTVVLTTSGVAYYITVQLPHRACGYTFFKDER